MTVPAAGPGVPVGPEPVAGPRAVAGAGAVLDDVESRPGSATSLLRTIVGAYLHHAGGGTGGTEAIEVIEGIAAADLVALLGEMGVGPSSARAAISRVKSHGLVQAVRVGSRPGYRVAPGAVPMLERGDRRIFSYRQQSEDDPWCLVSYTVPEPRRAARHQLRRHLTGIGCGRVATGLWICPAHLAGEVEEILAVLGLRDAATLFVTGTPRTPGPFAVAAERWWDLDGLAARHREFLARHDVGRTPRAPGSLPGVDAGSEARPREAFLRWTRVLDDWRPIPYLDPGLPPSALPGAWPGRRSVETFARLHAELAPAAHRYVGSVVG
ncbi:regulator [Isoptericola sp. NEAU-Y5]|uniref:Regulator n=1 Tax=Isoptericola luteus TaxID=2879484 RepID=A0ABS7ZGG8_9MICO|nr:PaaX family transcriptional regulator C-terminal domain-containing protein [Isoptericola sp. NEAU-Y5]MCA5894013.1 regulator [Isoptericola sp. NEAU-Y5]